MRVVKIEWIDSCTSNLNWELLDDVTSDVEPIWVDSYISDYDEVHYGKDELEFVNEE